MVVLYLCVCCLFNSHESHESYHFWTRGGLRIENMAPWERYRTSIAGLSGEMQTYQLKVEDDGSACLSLHDPGKSPSQFWHNDMFKELTLNKDDVFPLYGELYRVASVYFDDNRPKDRKNNRSSLKLIKLTSDSLPCPDRDCLVVSRSYTHGGTLVRWPSARINGQMDSIYVKGWTFEPDGNSATVHFERIEPIEPKRRPRRTEFSLKLQEGAVFEVHGKKVRLQAVVPPRKLDNNCRLTGWISFKGVEED